MVYGIVKIVTVVLTSLFIPLFKYIGEQKKIKKKSAICKRVDSDIEYYFKYLINATITCNILSFFLSVSFVECFYIIYLDNKNIFDINFMAVIIVHCFIYIYIIFILLKKYNKDDRLNINKEISMGKIKIKIEDKIQKIIQKIFKYAPHFILILMVVQYLTHCNLITIAFPYIIILEISVYFLIDSQTRYEAEEIDITLETDSKYYNISPDKIKIEDDIISLYDDAGKINQRIKGKIKKVNYHKQVNK